MDKAEKVFEKVAAILSVQDIERNLGTILSDPDEELVRKAITMQRQERFPLRHPVLTGLPTLGIAPAVSKHRATEEIVREMAKRSPAYRKAWERERRHRQALQLASAPRRNYNVNMNV